jgi:hypothetical protein
MKNNLQISLNLLVIAIGLFLFNQAKAQYAFVWAREFGTLNNFVNVHDIATDASNNFYVSGVFYDTLDVDFTSGTNLLTPGVNELAYFFLKYNSSGNLVWAKKLEAPSDVDLQFTNVTVDAAGYIYVSGRISTYSAVQLDLDPGSGTSYVPQTPSVVNNLNWIIKLNASGDFQWKQIFDNNVRSINIKSDNLGNIYVSGIYNTSVNFGPPLNITLSNNGISAFLAKYTSAGNFIWANHIATSNNNIGTPLSLYNLEIAGNKVYVSANYSYSNVDINPGTVVDTLTSLYLMSFISVFDTTGTFSWAKRFVGSSNIIRKLEIDANGNIYAAGEFTGTVDFDPNSSVQNLTSTGGYDAFVLKLDQNSNFQSVIKIGDDNDDWASGLVINNSGKLVITGVFQGTVDLNPGAGINSYTSSGYTDNFLLMLDASGNYDTSYVWGGDGYDTNGKLIKDNANSLYIFGSNGSSNMDYDNFRRGWSGVYYVMKLSGPSTGISIFEADNHQFTIFPNPATTQFTIANAEIGTCVSVIDITGKVMFTETVNTNTHVISTKDLVNGIYFVQLENNGQISQKKLVVNK